METIYALSTPHGKSGVAIIRVSGPKSFEAIETLCKNLPKSGRGVRKLYDFNNDLIDEALILAFDKNHSFTGEKTVELQIHGSIAVISSIFAHFQLLPYLKLAEAGEFTKSALQNGRLDLSQVEGLADLIDAETEFQKKQSLKIFSGALSELIGKWNLRLTRSLALAEATIDFAEEDVPTNVFPEVSELVSLTLTEMNNEINSFQVAERIRNGFEVAILGAPNVGKSTLLNYIAKRDVAITSEIAGTTRDVIEVKLDLNGLPVTILDTAGLRDTDDLVEGLGINRGIKRAFEADLVIYLKQNQEDRLNLNLDVKVLEFLSKQDEFDFNCRGISGKTGSGVDLLLDEIKIFLSQKISFNPTIIRQRHKVALQESVKNLENTLILINQKSDNTDLICEELIQAIRNCEFLLGRFDIESVLDEIFASFCIGK